MVARWEATLTADSTGEDWTESELDLIVADYFAMLEAELSGRAYVKARHNASLRERIKRTKGAVEFKHGNISAVLVELGLPIVRGYKPATNFQGAIFGAIDRFLTSRPEALRPSPPASVGVAEAPSLFEEPPPDVNRTARPQRPDGLERLVRKFDPVERDFRNRQLGEAGEACVLEFERARLEHADRIDLARNIRWVSKEDGDGAGYDILSFEATGSERLIEVKTTFGGRKTPFFVTRNEKALSDERPDAFHIYRVYDFSPAPRLFTIRPPLERAVLLTTENWRASFG